MESEPSKIKQVSTCLKHRGNIIACAVQLQFLCCTCIFAFKASGRCFYLTLRSIYLRKINITTSSTDSCFDKIMPQTEKDQFLVLLRLPQIFQQLGLHCKNFFSEHFISYLLFIPHDQKNTKEGLFTNSEETHYLICMETIMQDIVFTKLPERVTDSQVASGGGYS